MWWWNQYDSFFDLAISFKGFGLFISRFFTHFHLIYSPLVWAVPRLCVWYKIYNFYKTIFSLSVFYRSIAVHTDPSTIYGEPYLPTYLPIRGTFISTSKSQTLKTYIGRWWAHCEKETNLAHCESKSGVDILNNFKLLKLHNYIKPSCFKENWKLC